MTKVWICFNCFSAFIKERLYEWLRYYVTCGSLFYIFSVWIHFQSIQKHVFFSCFILNNNTQMSSGATADLNEQIQKMIFLKLCLTVIQHKIVGHYLLLIATIIHFIHFILLIWFSVAQSSCHQVKGRVHPG